MAVWTSHTPSDVEVVSWWCGQLQTWRWCCGGVDTFKRGGGVVVVWTPQTPSVVDAALRPLSMLSLLLMLCLRSGLQVNEDRWRGETVLQSTFSSKLLNLGQITASTSPPGTKSHLRPISSLLSWFHLAGYLSLSLQFLGRLLLAHSALYVAFFGSGAPCWCLWKSAHLRIWIASPTPPWGHWGSTHWSTPCCVSHTHTSAQVSGTQVSGDMELSSTTNQRLSWTTLKKINATLLFFLLFFSSWMKWFQTSLCTQKIFFSQIWAQICFCFGSEQENPSTWQVWHIKMLIKPHDYCTTGVLWTVTINEGIL